MRLFARGIAALALAACALGGAGEVPGQGAKVRLGVLKLTSSAVLFLGAEKGYFREFGVEPELVFFDAAQPIAVAIASGDRKSTRLNSSHTVISYAVFCLKKKT